MNNHKCTMLKLLFKTPPVSLMCVCACVFQVFIEFESVRDADRFGVWYSLLKQPCRHQVVRLKVPNSQNIVSPRKSLIRKHTRMCRIL